MDPFGFVMLVVCVLAVVLFVRKVRFTSAAQRVARRIGEEGGFAHREDLPRDARGKVERDIAVMELGKRQAEVEADPDDWRAWFMLGVAHGDVKDPHAAREAVRRAVALERAQSRGLDEHGQGV